MTRLREVMFLILADDGPLPAEWLDHELKGQHAGFRECHIGGDFLMIYLVENQKIVFSRCGTHAELFE